MGTYIYGRTQQVKTIPTDTGTEIEINLTKFLYKEFNTFLGDSRTEALQESLCTRMSNAWVNKSLPRFIITADKFSSYAEHAVYDTHASKNGGLGAVFTEYTDHGEHIGDMKKVGGRWMFFAKK